MKTVSTCLLPRTFPLLTADPSTNTSTSALRFICIKIPFSFLHDFAKFNATLLHLTVSLNPLPSGVLSLKHLPSGVPKGSHTFFKSFKITILLGILGHSHIRSEGGGGGGETRAFFKY